MHKSRKRSLNPPYCYLYTKNMIPLLIGERKSAGIFYVPQTRKSIGDFPSPNGHLLNDDCLEVNVVVATKDQVALFLFANSGPSG